MPIKKSSEKQHTLGGSARYSGIALHTGGRAHLKLKPAPANSGIQICRTDVAGKPSGPALATNVTEVQRATTIACGDSHVMTVEHVLAALHACGVDNAILELDGPEPPLADGSALPFVEMIESVGVKAQRSYRKTFVVTEPLWVESGDCRLVLLPYDGDGLRIACTVSYGQCEMDTQYLSLDLTRESFVSELCRARTFCEQYDVIETLMKKGLIRGASLDNAIVVKDGAIISKDGLRFSNEFVRHKMLDIVGDISLVGCRLQGQLIAIKPGHDLNVQLALKIMKLMRK